MAIILTYTIANEIVNLIQTIGVLLNVTNVIMGLTFLAWGNSIGDVVSDVALAKQGYPRMSMSACYGGPLFSILFPDDSNSVSCAFDLVCFGLIAVQKCTKIRKNAEIHDIPRLFRLCSPLFYGS